MHIFGYGPGFGIGFGIVDGDLKVHVAIVFAVEALDHAQRVGRRAAQLIQPRLAVETAGLDNQGVAVPSADGIAHPRRVQIALELAAIKEDLPPQIERFIKDRNEFRRLDDLPWGRRRVDFGDALGQAIGVRVFFGMGAVDALLEERFGPRLERNLARLEVGGQVTKVLVGVGLPDAREIGPAAGQPRRWRREIGPAVAGTRNARVGDLGPLRDERRGYPENGCQRGWDRASCIHQHGFASRITGDYTPALDALTPAPP